MWLGLTLDSRGGGGGGWWLDNRIFVTRRAGELETQKKINQEFSVAFKLLSDLQYKSHCDYTLCTRAEGRHFHYKRLLLFTDPR